MQCMLDLLSLLNLNELYIPLLVNFRKQLWDCLVLTDGSQSSRCGRRVAEHPTILISIKHLLRLKIVFYMWWHRFVGRTYPTTLRRSQQTLVILPTATVAIRLRLSLQVYPLHTLSTHVRCIPLLSLIFMWDVCKATWKLSYKMIIKVI